MELRVHPLCADSLWANAPQRGKNETRGWRSNDHRAPAHAKGLRPMPHTARYSPDSALSRKSLSIAMASPTPRWNGPDDYFFSHFLRVITPLS